ncbi:MAG: PVC-type heme-binding CxxCH protein [Verrucomicrobiales bacterium]
MNQFLLVFVLTLGLSGAVIGQESADPISLFDGETLAGWDYDPAIWRVEDGVITGGSRTAKIKKNYFISTERSFQNFELALSIRCSGDPKTGLINSGIQVRSVRVPGTAHVAGYQVDCGAGWFGKIYDEFRRRAVIAEPVDADALARAVDVFGWNDYRIRAEGPRIRVWINGVLTTDYTEKNPSVALDGVIAPQVHSGGVALVQFKDVSIVELPPTTGAPTWESLGGLEAALKKALPAQKRRKPNANGRGIAVDKIPAPPKGDDRVTFDFETGDLQGWYIAEGWFGHLLADNKTIRAGGASNKEGKFFMGTLEAAPGGVTGDDQTGIVESPVFELAGSKIQLAVSGGEHANTYVALCTLDGKEVRRASGNNSEVFQAKTWEVPELVGKPVFVRLVDRHQAGWGHIVLDAFSAEGKLRPEETKRRMALAKPKTPSAKEIAAAKAKAKTKRQGKKTQSARTTARSPAEQLAGFTVPDGFVIELVASEEHGVINPIDLTFDDAGRLWTQTAQMYPLDPISGMKWQQFLSLMKDEETQRTHPEFKRIKDLYELKTRGDDKILILDDPTKPASAPLHTWADGLSIPQSILPYKDGAYVCHGSELFFLRDSDGDGKADKMEPVLSGFGFTDTHTMSHLLIRGPGRYIHFSQGALNQGMVTAVASGFQDRIDAACQVRFDLEHQEFEVISAGPSNMWGLQLRGNGQWYGTEANDRAYSVIPWEHGTAVTGAAFRPMRAYQPLLPELHSFRVGGTGISGLAFTEDTEGGFPFEEWKDVALLANPITSTINAVRIHRNPNGTVEAEHLPDLLACEDDWFRPVNMEFGPDGCLYIADFYNKIVSHNEVTTDHPDRDKEHGRIWRIRHESQQPREIPDVSKASPEQLLTHLRSPSLWEKRAAWHQIGDRGLAGLAPQLIALAGDGEIDTVTRIHALWSLEELKHFDADLMTTLLEASDDDLRREAVRSLASFDLKPAEVASRLAEHLSDDNCMIRSQTIRTLGDLRSSDPAVIGLLIEACKPALPGNELGDSYERNFERFLARMALERVPDALKRYLDQSSRDHPASNVLWAIQALGDVEKKTAFLEIWGDVSSQPLDGETFVAIAEMLGAPEVFSAVKPIFQNPAKAKNLVALALANQSRVQSEALVGMLTPAVKQLLSSADTQALGLNAVAKFRIASLGDEVSTIKAPADDANLQRLLFTARTVDPARNAASFKMIAADAAAPFDLRIEAAHALAPIDREESYGLAKVLIDTGSPTQKAQVASIFSQSKAGSELLCRFVANRVILPNAFDLSAAERVSQAAPRNAAAREVISAARARVAKQRKDAQERIHALMAYIEKNPGDPEKGKLTFASCLACHRVGDEGLEIAPPLDGSGHRDLEHLLTAIVDPDAAVEGGYGLYRITRADGSVVEGLLDKSEALGTTVAMMGGHRIFVPQAEIKRAGFVGGRSFMLPAFGQLPEATMADLVAYIATLKEGEPPKSAKPATAREPEQAAATKGGLILDLDADHGVTVEDGDRVAKWQNQVAGARGQDFVKRDEGRKAVGSGRPTLRKAVKELNGHNSLEFLRQELVCMDEDAFDHLTQGGGATWLTVISVREQRAGLKDVNSFFGNLKNGKFYGGLWGCFNDDNSVWWGMRNGKSFGRFDNNNPKIQGPKLEVGKYYVVAGRIGAGTGSVALDLFVNNATPVASATIAVNPEDNPSKLAIGQERDAIQHPGKESFDGEIARFMVFDRPLTNAELAKQISTLQKRYGISSEAVPTAAQKKHQPNIILIFTDDQGYGDLSCYGGKHVSTPRIDQMAKEGAKLTSFYVAAPVCTPSRAGLMTGCYPKRINMATGSNFGVLLAGDKKGLNPDEITIAEVLKGAGYKTGMFGKWHLGDQPEFLPTRQGFDEFFGIPFSHDIHPFHPRQDKYNFPPLALLEGEKVIELDPDADFLTRRITEGAVKFIEKHKDEPFFLYVPHPIPHAPLHVSPPFMEGVADETVAKLKEEDGNIDYRTRDRLFRQAIAEIDWSVGQILDALKTNGLDDNTLVLFTSDNGPPKNTLHASPGILRGNKGTTWEGGMREPTVIRWPGKIAAGKPNDEMMTAMDLLPTFAKLAGAEIPSDRIIDGKDISAVLLGEAKSPHEKFFYHGGNTLRAVRSGKWKLHWNKRNPTQLYNLETDIAEKDNLIKLEPEIVNRLTGYLKDFEKEIATNNRPAGFVENPKPLAK